MEPITISCGTCHSRIRVRNPKMIGQVVNCPKCSGSILVAAPQQIRVEAAGTMEADSTSVTKEGLPLLEQDFSSFAPLDASFRNDGLPPSMPEPVEAAQRDDGSSNRAVSQSALLEAHLKNRESAAKTRQIVLVSCIALASIAAASFAFYGFLNFVSTGESKNPTADSKGSVDPSTFAIENQDKGSDAISIPAVDSATPGTAPLDPSLSTQAPNSLADSISPTPTPIPTTIDTSSGSPAESPTPATSAVDAGKTSVKPGDDPLAPNNPVVPPTDSDTTVAAKSSDSLPPALKDFAELFERTFEPVISDSTMPVAPAPSAVDDAAVGAAAAGTAQGAAGVAPVLPPVLSDLLDIQIAGLVIQKKTLSEVVAAIGAATAVPITIDFDSLRAGQVQRTTPIQLAPIKDQKLSSTLEAVGSAAGIELVPIENSLLMIQASQDAIQKAVPTEISVADLANTEEQTTWLVESLKTLLPELQGDLRVVDGKLTSGVANQNRLLWFQVLRLMECWRAQKAGKVEADSPWRDSLYLDWPTGKISGILQQPLPETTHQEQPAALAMVRACRGAKLECWVDWTSTAKVEFLPTKTDVVLTNNRTLQQVLRHFANSFGVIFAIEDESTLWVTTAKEHRRQPRVYVVPRGTLSIEQWQEQLKPLAPLAGDGSNELKVISSPDQSFLFLRCCRPIAVP